MIESTLQEPIRVLLVEDNSTDALVAQDDLAYAVGVAFTVKWVQRLQGALDCLAEQSFDVVLLDLNLPDSDGMGTFSRLRVAAPTVPMVVLSNRADEALALQAVKAGAQDYLVKGHADGLLVRTIRYAIERAHTEGALRVAERRLQLAVAGTNDGLWDWPDVTFGALWWSPSYYAQLGYTPENLHSTIENFFELLHPDCRDRVRQAHDNAISSLDAVDYEYQIKTSDGEYRWFLARGKACGSDTGPLVRMSGSTQDIHDRRLVREALQESQASYCALVEWSPIGIVVYQANNLVYANPAAIRLMGATSVGQLVGQPIWRFGHSKSVDGAQARVDRVLTSSESAVTREEQFIRLDGLVMDVEVQDSAIQYEGSPAVQVNFIDITERKAALSRQQLAASVFAHARESIMITDASGLIVEVNNTFTQVTGYTREEVLGNNPRILSSGRQGANFYTAMWQDLATHGHWSGEVWNRRKDGQVFAELLTISAVRDAQGNTQNYVSLATDITQSKEHQQQLEQVAHYDALTGLPNRVLLADRLKQAMAHCQRRGHGLAVVYLDLDGFKEVNDQYGHASGDELLVALSQLMKTALREGDTLARMGGDEFVAVLVDLEQSKDCEPVLARLIQATSSAVNVGTSVLQVSASIGVTLYPQDGADAEQLMRHADQAMYLAKLAGKGRYHLFDVAHDMATKTQREGLKSIRVALEREEFLLYYQPKVNMKTGEVIGAEALIRWQHPERGLLPPGVFLPIIEDHPMSVEIGEWVITTALKQMATWKAQGLDISVSVNIGARQLQQGNFPERLQSILALYPQVKPGHLELEILETSALEDIAQVSDVMHACHALGVHFALDDFGTGYSSLIYLKRLPAELLKIDQSFVRDMLNDADDMAIVKGVIGLALAFRREVIAEGVETIAHGALLLSLGCHLAQGYGIARPMPAAALPVWVASWRPDPSWKL
jgi:diguanylate cyclase (GGDEF)-like protein/PAS domain S-box-containing protein